MPKYSKKENEDLIETIKNPIRYYKITLWGYGGESAYLELTKEQYEFWKAKDEEEYDTTLNYILECEENGKPEWVPEEMDFMKATSSEGEVYYNSWYDAPTEFCHQWGVSYDSARINIDEVDSDEYGAEHLNTALDNLDLKEHLETIMEENDWNIELTNMDVAQGTDDQPKYVLQFYSSEKGTFFEGIFSSQGPLDIKKLKVFTEEFPNGEDIITSISYDGQDIENSGGDTNGKGYSVHLWENE